MWLSILLGLAKAGLGSLNTYYKAKADAEVRLADARTEQEKIDAERDIKMYQGRIDVIENAQKDPYERFVRIGFASPFVIYVWKLVVWDKTLGLGATDPLSEDLMTLMWIVVAGYFADGIVKKVMRK